MWTNCVVGANAHCDVKATFNTSPQYLVPLLWTPATQTRTSRILYCDVYMWLGCVCFFNNFHGLIAQLVRAYG